MVMAVKIQPTSLSDLITRSKFLVKLYLPITEFSQLIHFFRIASLNMKRAKRGDSAVAWLDECLVWGYMRMGIITFRY